MERPQLRRVMGPRLLTFFIVGDVLGAGIYAVTGDIAAQVGGLAWLPFLLAFAVAGLTATSYLHLVTRYPQAAGAALYAQRAFGVQFLTFLVGFAVICSGIASASTSSGLLASNLLAGLDRTVGHEGAGWVSVPTSDGAAVVLALAFMLVLAAVTLRGVKLSVRLNVVLTVIELLALLIVIGIGFYVMTTREGSDPQRMLRFENVGGSSALFAVTVATAIAFFAMVGFEDSVNMVEETKNPQRNFPRAMGAGLGIAALLYVLVAVAVVVVLPQSEIEAGAGSEKGVLLTVVTRGLPGFPVGAIFPFLTVFAVANTALINMLMASRLVYGMAREGVLPRSLGRVLPQRRTPWSAICFTTGTALVLIYVASRLAKSSVAALSGTTGLLLLGVFTVVNVAASVLRREPESQAGFTAPAFAPIVGAVGCALLAGPWARTESQMVQYRIAGTMIAVGVVLGAVMWGVNRRLSRRGQVDD